MKKLFIGVVFCFIAGCSCFYKLNKTEVRFYPIQYLKNSFSILCNVNKICIALAKNICLDYNNKGEYELLWVSSGKYIYGLKWEKVLAIRCLLEGKTR